ncbi:MAG: sugar ABC transporter permease, partial [bacterium]|nr:sugar ABC transporter permease [bacterium]
MASPKRTTELSNFSFALLLALPVLVFLLLVVAYPLGYALWMSTHDITFFGGYRTEFVGLEHFVEILDKTSFWKSVRVTVRFTVESVVLTMVLGLIFALILNRPMRFAGLMRTLVILPWCVSLYGTGIMFSQLAKGQTGLGT